MDNGHSPRAGDDGGQPETLGRETMNTAAALLAAALLAGSAMAPVQAKDHKVQMLNQGKDGPMVFEPGFIKASPGDTVTFVATDPGHNAQTIAGMLPDGEAEQKGAMGKNFVMTVKAPGLYGIKCLPHYSMGMVALVQVGKGPSANLAPAKGVKLPPLAKKRMDAWLAQAN
jgi:pseudoazurin